jgi:hypothetical protein
VAVVDPNQVVDVAFRTMEERFWHRVAETLDRIFANGRGQAAEYRRRLGAYREQVAHAPAEEQLLVYHSEPLDIAADLAGARVTPGHIAAYHKLEHAPAEA